MSTLSYPSLSSPPTDCRGLKRAFLLFAALRLTFALCVVRLQHSTAFSCCSWLHERQQLHGQKCRLCTLMRVYGEISLNITTITLDSSVHFEIGGHFLTPRFMKFQMIHAQIAEKWTSCVNSSGHETKCNCSYCKTDSYQIPLKHPLKFNFYSCPFRLITSVQTKYQVKFILISFFCMIVLICLE